MVTIRSHEFRIVTRDSRRVSEPPRNQKPVDPWYRTPQHREWAKAVVERAGHQCQDPEHDPRQARRASRLFADHIVELQDGGSALDLRNGMALCGACHQLKTMRERIKRMMRC
jgi:5-methylcytosine-specific restriction endonuclease McrA